MTSTPMVTHLGRALFALGVVLAIALAAPVPKWESARAALAPLVSKAKDAKLPVVVEDVSADDEKQAAEWHERLSQVLELGGVEVIKREEIDPAVGVLALKATLRSESSKAMLYAEGAAGPIASAELALDPKWPWTTTMWALFAFVTAAGVALWRHGVRSAAKAGLENVSDEENPFALLARLLPPARALGEQLGQLDEREIPRRATELLDDYVLPFAVVRQKVIDRLGMKVGSEILVVLAYGERMLNRVVSAAADGHLPEAQASYPSALAALEEANRLAKAALAQGDSAGSTNGTGAPSGSPVAANVGD